MIEQELQEIKDRSEKATPGEWRAVHEDGGFYVQAGESPDTTIVVTQSFAPPWNDANDAAFIAHAHQDIPALIQAVEERDRRIENGLAALVCLHAFLEQIPQAVKLAAMINIWFSEFTDPNNVDEFLAAIIAAKGINVEIPPPSQPSDLTQQNKNEGEYNRE